MVNQTAEESFVRGKHAFEQGRKIEAMALFEAAIELQRRLTKARPQARYLSFYGLCLALERNDIREAVRFCREAVTIEGYNADIRANLGRVLMRAGRRREAYLHFVKGLRTEPRHPHILRALRQMGLRKRPVLPFLARTNPLNVVLGRLRVRAN
jgi:tetratricopeptide (TPR) repeat protein